MCLYVHVCIFVFVCIWMYICVYLFICLFICVCAFALFAHVWVHLFAPNHVQVFGSHFRVMWRSFLARIAYCSFSSAAVVCQDSASWLQWYPLDLGRPATAHLPPSCVQQDTECFFSRMQEACGLAVPGRAGSSFSQYCLLHADGHKKRWKWEGLGARQSEPLKMSKVLATSSLVTPCLAGSLAGFLSALLREALLIHPPENGRFIHIDIINEEPGSMLYQLTPQGKVKWAFFWRVVPKLRSVTHSK